MTEITIGQIATLVAFIATLASGITILITQLKKALKKALREEFDGLKGDIKELQSRVENVDVESTKNFLVLFLARVDRGENVDEIERERFWEQYQHYRNHNGNSYIKNK